MTVVEKSVERLSTTVDSITSDVKDLQVRVSVLTENVNTIKSDVSSLASTQRQKFVNGFISLFLLISLGLATNSVSSQNMERQMKATRLDDIERMEATRLEDIERMEATRLEDIERMKNNRGVDRMVMFAIAILPLLGPIVSKTLNFL